MKSIPDPSSNCVAQSPTFSMARGLTRGKGFTVVELLVVISVISLLLALLLPALSSARESAMLSLCGGNQRQLYVAGATYAADYRDRLPAAANFSSYPMMTVSGNFGRGNQIDLGGLGGSGGPTHSLGAFIDDYTPYRRVQAASPNTIYKVFPTTNSLFHCPRGIKAIEAHQNPNQWYFSTDYFLAGFGQHMYRWNNSDPYLATANAERVFGFTQLSQFHNYQGSPITMFVDMYNHFSNSGSCRGNLTTHDGSVKGFESSESYLFTGEYYGQIYIPKGYATFMMGQRTTNAGTGGYNGDPIVGLYFRDGLGTYRATGNGLALSGDESYFGYGSGGY